MAKDCVGEGTGWGTIENVTLRVLLLVAPDRDDAGASFERALEGRHEVTRLAGAAGFGASLTSGKAARHVDPHLLHAFGIGGYAKTAGTVAAGMNKPLVVSLTLDDVRAEPRRTKKLASRADALVLDDTEAADAVRALGVERDLYVIGQPRDDEALSYLLGAYEIVYGRVLGARETELEEDAATYEVASDGLVQIGSLAKKGS